MASVRTGTPIESLDVAAFTVPTDAPEADGTLEWDRTTLVVVTVEGGDRTGTGYTYADLATAELIHGTLAEVVTGSDALAPRAVWSDMVRLTRNLGRPGIVSMAISAVDLALWDLKARIHELPLCELLGGVRREVPLYGSGGFTTYDQTRLNEQLAGWIDTAGMKRVKMKIGTNPDADPERVRGAREAIGTEAELFVDANGAYDRKQALAIAEIFREDGRVSWFEEPVSSDDLQGLRLIRDRGPAGMEIAAGEYGYDVNYFNRMLKAGAVDVLQADVTRCGGITELLRVDGLCRANEIELSLHCAPAIHAHPACVLDRLVHLEYFHDHVRIEAMLFDGVAELSKGSLWPDRSRPGNGLDLKWADAERYRQ